MELFPAPSAARRPAGHERSRRLPRDQQQAVFGQLPSSLARDLDTEQGATAVQVLLAAGWRPGQLAARIGALPAGPDPVAGVLSLLGALTQQEAPDRMHAGERGRMADQAASAGRSSSAAAEQPASQESRERWLRQIRQQLGSARPVRPAPPARIRPPCALCGGVGALFVTRAVRLCTNCVAALEAGQLSLPATG